MEPWNARKQTHRADSAKVGRSSRIKQQPWNQREIYTDMCLCVILYGMWNCANTPSLCVAVACEAALWRHFLRYWVVFSFDSFLLSVSVKLNLVFLSGHDLWTFATSCGDGGCLA